MKIQNQGTDKAEKEPENRQTSKVHYVVDFQGQCDPHLVPLRAFAAAKSVETVMINHSHQIGGKIY